VWRISAESAGTISIESGMFEIPNCDSICWREVRLDSTKESVTTAGQLQNSLLKRSRNTSEFAAAFRSRAFEVPLFRMPCNVKTSPDQSGTDGPQPAVRKQV
jgi:hypothetical protein